MVFGVISAEDQHHQGEGHGGDQDAGVAPQAYGDDGCDRRGEDIHQVVADQDQADKPVRTLQQFAGAYGATVLVFLQVLQPIAVERHHARFRAGEEGGKRIRAARTEKSRPSEASFKAG